MSDSHDSARFYASHRVREQREDVMGKFMYEGIVKVDFDDRALAHLQLVIGTKLRRGESFNFTWKDDASIGDGRTTVWVHPRSTLVYKFYGSRKPVLNRAWVDALLTAAHSSSGLYLVPEPPAPAAQHLEATG